MRNTKHVREVLCADVQEDPVPNSFMIPHGFERNCFNVFILADGKIGWNFKQSPTSPFALEVLRKCESDIAKLEKAVYRCFPVYSANFRECSATAYALAPLLLATNGHVVKELQPKMIFSKYYTRCTTAVIQHTDALCDPLSRDKFLLKFAEEDAIEFSGFALPNIRKVRNTIMDVSRVDPILGSTGGFDMFDFALVSTQHTGQERVIFVPSPTCVKQGDAIASLGFPGLEAMEENQFKMGTPDSFHSTLPPFWYIKKIFHDFGNKCVSVGRVLNPYELSTEGWVEKKDFVFTPHNHIAIISNEATMVGCSGAPVVNLNNLLIHEEKDVHGEMWTLVEYVGTHSGGEFVYCQDCLRTNPSSRVGWEHSQKLGAVCLMCRANPDRKTDSFCYNYSLSVHHPQYVNMYKKHVAPRLESLFGKLPSCVEQFLCQHDDVEDAENGDGSKTVFTN